MSLRNNLYTLKNNFSRVFKKLARFNVSKVYHGTSQYTAFDRRIYLAPSESRVGLHPLACNVHAPNPLNFRVNTSNCILPIDNRGRKILLAHSTEWLAPANQVLFTPYYNILFFTVFSLKQFWENIYFCKSVFISLTNFHNLYHCVQIGHMLHGIIW